MMEPDEVASRRLCDANEGDVRNQCCFIPSPIFLQGFDDALQLPTYGFRAFSRFPFLGLFMLFMIFVLDSVAILNIPETILLEAPYRPQYGQV